MPGCALTQGYVQDCQNFFGGIKTVFVIEFPNVTTLTVVAGVVTVLTKATGKSFRKYDIHAHTAEAEDAGAVTKEAGTRMTKQSVKFPINGLSAAMREEIDLLAQNRLMFVMLDNNGLYWLYGANFGMRLNTYTAKTGSKLSDRNGYELAFEGEEKFLAPNVGNAIGIVLETVGV